MKYFNAPQFVTSSPLSVSTDTGPALDDWDDWIHSPYLTGGWDGKLEDFEGEGTWSAVDFARDTWSYIQEEASMPALKAQFQSARGWWEILGLSFRLTQLANSGKLKTPTSEEAYWIGKDQTEYTEGDRALSPGEVGYDDKYYCCEGWERQLKVPKLADLIQFSRDAQASYVNKLQDLSFSGPGGVERPKFPYTDIDVGVQWDQLQYFYADIITAREDLWQEVIDQIESGKDARGEDIILTPLEMEALALAEEWKQMIIVGGTAREEAEIAAGLKEEPDLTMVRSPVRALPTNLTPKLTLPTGSGTLFGNILPMKKYPLLQTVAITAGAVYLINKVVL